MTMRTVDDMKQLASGTPSFRIKACGPFLVERWDGSSYQSIPIRAWDGNTSRLLLKALLCAPDRYAKRGKLLEDLWPDIPPKDSATQLNNVVYKLRRVLRRNPTEESLLLTGDHASCYRLANQQQIWVDADAALTLLTRAEEVERQGGDPLPLLEQAACLLSRGEFLEGEEELWAHGRRRTISDMWHGCRLWQARLYERRSEVRRAELLLRALLEENRLDEDALRQLMLNLHQQERTSEALRLYETIAKHLAEDRREPTEMTKAIWLQLRSET